MSAFGFEIRRVGDVQSLYKEIDLVLSKDINISKMTVAHMITKMFKPDKYLDLCNIKAAAQLCGIVIPEERLLIYHTMHCTNWNEMLPEYRHALMAMIMDDFRPVLNP